MKEAVQNEPKSGGILYRARLRSGLVANPGAKIFLGKSDFGLAKQNDIDDNTIVKIQYYTSLLHKMLWSSYPVMAGRVLYCSRTNSRASFFNNEVYYENLQRNLH